ncbi:Alpha-D-glucose-1-phosphate phosphatase YihX [Polystyrenella longa]|uniref:Alpha-D-glucose-1-phosphate phosphatase YihX n=1 Tax=Polystyrenella longa TaxID=2528007 RepID=A0A518CSF5_9PLAN|nr:HAD family phosphatase [Polystyrenella longa]QDU82145.1 Alpha-D-glucose-1-phosphate phosphatase YihX [Polystyrenella longa]
MLKTILFDMGNVLVTFCHDRMCRQIGDLYQRSEAEVRELLMGSGIQSAFERGTLQPYDLWHEFQLRFGPGISPEVTLEQLERAGSDIFTLNEGIPQLLEELKSLGMRLVLLSNTSISHFEFIMREFQVLQHFDDYVTSYEVGAMKPDVEIYKAALEKIDCAPEECFYTDDIELYVETARTFDLNAEVFTAVPELRTHLRRLGLKVDA